MLDGKVRKMIGSAMKNIFLPYNIIQLSETASSNPWEPPTQTETIYPCRAVVTSYRDYEIDGEKIRHEDMKVIILAEGLAIKPQVDDYIYREGEARKYKVVSPVTVDAAGATFTCQCR